MFLCNDTVEMYKGIANSTKTNLYVWLENGFCRSSHYLEHVPLATKYLEVDYPTNEAREVASR